MGNGDVGPITRLEPAQAPRNDHNNVGNSIEGKPGRDENVVSSIIDHSSSDRNRAFDPRDFSNSMHDPGRNNLNTKDGSTHDNAMVIFKARG